MAPVRTGPRGLTGWHDVCRLNEIRPNRARFVLINGVEIVLCRADDEVYALGARCSYRNVPLTDGLLRDNRLICPLHGCDYDLISGISPTRSDWRLPVYVARVQAEIVQLNADSVSAGPGMPDAYLGRWARRELLEPAAAAVHALADGDRATSELAEPSEWDTLLLRPGPAPLTSNHPVNTSVVLGTQAARPLRLEMPVLIGHISYGAVSIEAKVALARGARLAGTALGSGDGGSHGRERDATDRYIVQVPAQSDVDLAALSEADAIEINCGEAGRPGRGPYLPTHKVSTEVALHRNVSPGAVLEQPVLTPTAVRDALPDYIAKLRAAGAGVPIGAKIPAHNLEHDLAILVASGIDFVTVETAEASASGSQGAELARHTGLRGMVAVRRAREWLNQHSPHVQLVIAGGFSAGDQIAKALALGADAVAIGKAALWAVGCQNYQACDGGHCPVGIATQDPTLRLRLNPDISARRVATYLRALTERIADYCRVVGHDAIDKLTPGHLMTADMETALLTKVPWVGDS